MTGECKSAQARYRRDIDGLRAVAILSVVGLHAFSQYLPGGFVGVDVFFVISGFLISGILMRGLAQGNLSYTAFYAGRVRRIFPALILVLVVSMIAGWFILIVDEYRQLGFHTFAGAAFFANFVFLDETGYFDKAAELKPMLHLWSLGIEEQFYIFWPFLLAVAWKRGRSTVTIILVIIASSFALNIWGTVSKPTAAFYLPFPRFWELLAGALLAHAAMHEEGRVNACLNFGIPRDSRLFIYLPDVKALFGILMILAALFMLHRDSLFPGLWVLLPVVGACLLISAGDDTWINRRVLASRGMIFVGLISYPLYLWHWPLLSFARIVDSGEPGLFVRVTAVALSFVLATLTYRLVEHPVRFGALRSRSCLVPALSLTMCVAAAAGVWIYKQNGFPGRISTDLEKYQQLVNSPGEINGCKKYYPFARFCISSQNVADGGPMIMALGDSHALALAHGLEAMTEKDFPDYSFLSVGRGGCPPFEDVERIDKEKYNCAYISKQAMEIALEPRVHKVLLASRWTSLPGGDIPAGDTAAAAGTGVFVAEWGGATVTDQTEIFSTGLTNTLRTLIDAGKQVYFVHVVPELEFDPRECLRRPFRLSGKYVRTRCAMKRHEVIQRQSRYRHVVDQVLKDFPTVKVFDPLQYLCDVEYCQAIIEDRMLYSDDDHLSLDGAAYLSGPIADLLRDQGGRPGAQTPKQHGS